MAFGALEFNNRGLDIRVIRRDLLRPGVIGLQFFQDHRAGHTGGSEFSGFRNERALGHLAMHVTIENFQDPGVEITCFLAGCSSHRVLPSMLQVPLFYRNFVVGRTYNP